MEAYLRHEGLWEITTQLPPILDAKEERLNRQAYAAIVMALDDSQSKITLTRRLYHARLAPVTSMTAHLQRMKQMFADHEEKGLRYVEQHKAFTILSSLDASFDTLEALPEAHLTMEYLCS